MERGNNLAFLIRAEGGADRSEGSDKSDKSDQSEEPSGRSLKTNGLQRC